MFRYILAFLLINTCYQSLGNPIQPSAPNLSKSLATLATHCNSSILSMHLLGRIKDCAVSGIPPYSKRQIQCLILYDISTQLCSAVVTSKLILSEDSFSKLHEKQDVNAVCTLAKEWVFTNLSDYEKYQDSAERFFKRPATCGEACGAEDDLTEANFYCKYYKTGLSILKAQLASTVANNAVAAPIISDPDVTPDNAIPANSDPVKPQDTNTKTISGQIKQTESVVAKTTPQKVEDAIDDAVVKSETAVQATSKQTPSIEADNAENADDSDVNVRQDDTAAAAPESAVPQDNKTVVVQAEKPVIGNEAVMPDLPVAPIGEQKQAGVKDNSKPKAIGDAEEYESEDGDEDPNDETAEIKPETQPANQQNYVPNNLVVSAAHEAEVSQKEFFPNSMPDGFSDEDDDHFFPFFMTSVILMVLLYVLYHNKSKVSKVFFGLILEGRQSGRRRNSRGHAYRRLDTLEQAMSANTAAPPSKIIY